VPRSVAMKLTGHKTKNVYRRYAIVSEPDLDEAARRLCAAGKLRAAATRTRHDSWRRTIHAARRRYDERPPRSIRSSAVTFSSRRCRHLSRAACVSRRLAGRWVRFSTGHGQRSSDGLEPA
jgi:hypothetical protein